MKYNLPSNKELFKYINNIIKEVLTDYGVKLVNVYIKKDFCDKKEIFILYDESESNNVLIELNNIIKDIKKRISDYTSIYIHSVDMYKYDDITKLNGDKTYKSFFEKSMENIKLNNIIKGGENMNDIEENKKENTKDKIKTNTRDNLLNPVIFKTSILNNHDIDDFTREDIYTALIDYMITISDDLFVAKDKYDYSIMVTKDNTKGLEKYKVKDKGVYYTKFIDSKIVEHKLLIPNKELLNNKEVKYQFDKIIDKKLDKNKTVENLNYSVYASIFIDSEFLYSEQDYKSVNFGDKTQLVFNDFRTEEEIVYGLRITMDNDTYKILKDMGVLK